MKAFEILRRAQAEKFALGAFNAASIETLKAIVGAAQKLKSPVIIEASQGETNFFGLNELAATVRALEKDAGVPIILNADHAPGYEACRQALVAGFDYLHLDGSKLPYEQNVAETKKIVAEAHAQGVPVEGEINDINALGAASADNRGQNIETVRKAEIYTDPIAAQKFVEATGVDTFASFVGNVHGLYQGAKTIDLALLKKIAAALPGKFLSLHGGSGISEGEIREAIKLGVVKINVNSELRIAFHDALREIVNGSEGGEVAIYKIMPKAIAAMEKIVEAKIHLFGSAGKI